MHNRSTSVSQHPVRSATPSEQEPAPDDNNMKGSHRPGTYRVSTTQALATVVLFMVIMYLTCYYTSLSHACPYKWHGGSPGFQGGSCWCGADAYCMCTPSLAIDAIIEAKTAESTQLILIKRKDPPKDLYAIVGGFVEVGESVEDATIREVKEETNVTIRHHNIIQFHVYSDPKRDKRRHTVSAVSRCLLEGAEAEAALRDIHVGDDAKKASVVHLNQVLAMPLAFDHRQVLKDYIKRFHPSTPREG